MYKLEGLDKDWKIADKNNQAIYTYLPPGTYTFFVKSVDAEGTGWEKNYFSYNTRLNHISGTPGGFMAFVLCCWE